MTYDEWKCTNPDDRYLGPEPAPCHSGRCSLPWMRKSTCAYCGAPEDECWWHEQEEPLGWPER